MTGPALRVLMVTPFSPLHMGGVERYVWEVSTRLLDRGLHVEVLCTDPGGGPIGVQHVDGLAVRTVRAWPRGRDWCLAPGLWRQIDASWDVIHVQSYHTLVAPLAMLRARQLGTPYCVTFHGGGSSSELRNRARPLQWRLLAPLLAHADALVAVARFEVDRFGKALGIPPERFRVIPIGTDLEFDGSPAVAFDGDGEVLATIGRLERYKGHQRVIAAMPHVLRARPHARLLVVGSGPWEAELRESALRLGLGDRVQFTSVPPGDRRAMSEVLARVSIVVLMSEFETHPLVALEAAAARRRLLVADDGAGLSELAADGLARAIPPTSTPEQTAAAVLEELEKPPPTRRPALSTWDECVDALVSLYRELRARTQTDR